MEPIGCYEIIRNMTDTREKNNTPLPVGQKAIMNPSNANFPHRRDEHTNWFYISVRRDWRPHNECYNNQDCNSRRSQPFPYKPSSTFALWLLGVALELNLRSIREALKSQIRINFQRNFKRNSSDRLVEVLINKYKEQSFFRVGEPLQANTTGLVGVTCVIISNGPL